MTVYSDLYSWAKAVNWMKEDEFVSLIQSVPVEVVAQFLETVPIQEFWQEDPKEDADIRAGNVQSEVVVTPSAETVEQQGSRESQLTPMDVVAAPTTIISRPRNSTVSNILLEWSSLPLQDNGLCGMPASYHAEEPDDRDDFVSVTNALRNSLRQSYLLTTLDIACRFRIGMLLDKLRSFLGVVQLRDYAKTEFRIGRSLLAEYLGFYRLLSEYVRFQHLPVSFYVLGKSASKILRYLKGTEARILPSTNYLATSFWRQLPASPAKNE